MPVTSPNRALVTSPLAGGMTEIDLSSPLNYGTPGSLGSIRTPRSGIRGTPHRTRPDIRVDKRVRQVNVEEPVSCNIIRYLAFKPFLYINYFNLNKR